MNEPASPNFEQALSELAQILQDLEDGSVGLEESLTRYEHGVRLLKQCYALLEKAERRIELCTGLDADGNPIVQPFDEQALTLAEKADARSQRRSKTAAKSKTVRPADDLPDENSSAPGLF